MQSPSFPSPNFSAANAKAVQDPELGTLPVWDLKDLYKGMTDKKLERDLLKFEKEAAKFRKRYEGKLKRSRGERIAKAVKEYEALSDGMGKVMSFSGLLRAGNMTDPEISQFYQTMSERVTAISSDTLFFTLELNKLDDAKYKEKLETPELAHYEPWLSEVRSFKEHQLSDELEAFLHEQSVAGRASWVRLFDETMAGLRFPYQGEELTSAVVLSKLSDPDETVRKEAGKSVGKVLGENSSLFTLITNTLAKDKEISNRWRKFERPVSSKNLANMVEDEVVDALVKSVSDAYPKTAHRYYALKAKWMGKEQLDYWDRNAPLPSANQSLVPWDQAKKRVLDSYYAFSSELGDVGKLFFDNDWIDVPTRPGKAPGAFAHPTVPSAHPYLLLNYQGRTRDVMTLAHELGHGVHQVLAGEQGALMAGTPLTLAETASVFGEMLTFRSLLDEEKDPTNRKIMLAGKVEDMLNTVVRQIAFHQFETAVHDARKESELLPDDLAAIWLKVQVDSLGPAVRWDDEYKHYWSYIPHFIHSPFYVYAYAFGDCLVNSLYAVYENAESGFAEKYLEMLKAGGSKGHKELLAPFGLDASDPKFWDQGISLLSRFIDELEAMD
jgi:oligoendopeptidase F